MPIIIDEMKNGWTERVRELEAENKRLREVKKQPPNLTAGEFNRSE